MKKIIMVLVMLLVPVTLIAAWSSGSNISVMADSLIDAAGDLVVGTADNTAGRIAIGGAGTMLQSNGTTAAWSTPKFTTSQSAGSATSGPVLFSNGTTYTSTTAKYPAASTDTAVLIGNGTDYVPSTSRWTNTQSASGVILQSNGTTYTGTSYKLPTAVSSAATVLMSNGTDYTGSTVKFPTVGGSAGGLMRTDGTVAAWTTPTRFSSLGIANLDLEAGWYDYVEVAGGGVVSFPTTVAGTEGKTVTFMSNSTLTTTLRPVAPILLNNSTADVTFSGIGGMAIIVGDGTGFNGMVVSH